MLEDPTDCSLGILDVGCDKTGKRLYSTWKQTNKWMNSLLFHRTAMYRQRHWWTSILVHLKLTCCAVPIRGWPHFVRRIIRVDVTGTLGVHFVSTNVLRNMGQVSYGARKLSAVFWSWHRHQIDWQFHINGDCLHLNSKLNLSKCSNSNFNRNIQMVSSQTNYKWLEPQSLRSKIFIFNC